MHTIFIFKLETTMLSKNAFKFYFVLFLISSLLPSLLISFASLSLLFYPPLLVLLLPLPKLLKSIDTMGFPGESH
jgi:hypothetical protein